VSQRFFRPECIIWRVDREMALLLAGGRALLMQLAHPKIAAGVADHSGFREDPLGRLHRTTSTMWSIVFDEMEQAQASLQRVKDIHGRVHGLLGAGDVLPVRIPYDAQDPDLLLWVHATLVDSAILTYELFVRPLSAQDKAQYYDETKTLALLFEVPQYKIPVSLDAFNAYMSAMIAGDVISVGPTARALAEEILHPRPLVLKLGGPLFAFITAGLLPQGLREAYELKWNERKERKLQFLAALVRGMLPFVPSLLRIVPHARAAEKRLAWNNEK